MYIFFEHKVERRHGTESPASSCSSSSSSSSISSCRRRRRRGCRPHTQCLLSVLRVFLHSGAVVTFLSCCIFISYLPAGNDTDALTLGKARHGTASTQKGEREREREEPACPAAAAAAANVVVGRRSLHLGSLIVQCVYVLCTHTHTHTEYVCAAAGSQKNRIENKRGGGVGPRREGASLLRELNAVHTQPAYYLLKNKTRRRSNCLLLLLLLLWVGELLFCVCHVLEERKEERKKKLHGACSVTFF